MKQRYHLPPEESRFRPTPRRLDVTDNPVLRQADIVVGPQDQIARQPLDDCVQGMRLALLRNKQPGERQLAGKRVEYRVGIVRGVIVGDDQLPRDIARNRDLGQRRERTLQQAGTIPRADTNCQVHGKHPDLNRDGGGRAIPNRVTV